MEKEAPDGYEELAGYLKALAHPSRLELLSQLRVPRTLGEMRLKPRRQESEGNPDRNLSRTGAERHLVSLKAIGVITRRSGVRDGRPVDEYLLQHQRLFQVFEELRDLTRLRPLAPASLERTIADEPSAAPARLEGPGFVLLSGPAEGSVHPLQGSGPWTVGRASPATVVVDHDPFVSTEHARVLRDAQGFHVEDNPANRNGTFVNWGLLPKGGRARLRTGDVVRVGRSLLLFREP